MIRAGIIALFVLSCTQRTKVPETVLPPDKMEKLLLDLMSADEFFNQKQADSTTIDSFNRIALYQSVFALHKTNKKHFQRSFTYYEKHPDLLKIVLDSMYSKANKPPEVLDSTKRSDLKSKILKKNKPPVIK